MIVIPLKIDICMWESFKQFVESYISPPMVFEFWIYATYAALLGLLLLFVPIRHAEAGDLKKRMFANAVNVLVWCGYLGPCIMSITQDNIGYAEDPRLFMVKYAPGSDAFLVGMVVVGFILMWYYFSVDLRKTVLVAGCLTVLLEPLFLALLFPIILMAGLVLELTIAPILLIVNVLRLLNCWRSSGEHKCRCEHECHCEPGKDGKDGKDGLDGEDGSPGQDGEKGDKGDSGRDGKDGRDGHDGLDGKNGRDGRDGQDGRDGRNGRVIPIPPPTPTPIPPHPEPNPTPGENESQVAVRALVLSGILGSKTFTPNDSSKRSFILSGQAMESIDGGSDYPTVIGSFNASAGGRVWTFLPSLPEDWQMQRNAQPMKGVSVLSAGDTLTLHSAASPDPTATLHVSFRMSLVTRHH